MLLVALLAVCWLVYRLVRFVTIPVSSIVATLGVRTPAAAKVSVDKVTEDSITVHWENEPLEMVGREEEAVCYYILYLNGFQIAVFHNNPRALYTCCNIKGLESDAEFQFDFVSINRMGYVNKLPSVYCKTAAAGVKAADVPVSGGSGHVAEVDFDLMVQQDFDTDGKKRWRRNTLVKKGSGPSKQEDTVVQNLNAGEHYPSYNSLTTLKALENYTVDDLKKILVCAQEDLHDVLAQEQSLMEDFQESQEQLQLELENLRTNWAHEINLRKTLKSSIKSLENSKMLTDLKTDKLKKKINDLKFKISRMEKDMKDWNKENEVLCNKDIKGSFEVNIRKNNKMEQELKEELQKLQIKLSEAEEEHKRILAMKPTTENLKRSNASGEKSPASPDEKNNTVESIIKEMEPLLANFSKVKVNNPPFSKLSPNSEILKLIKEQKSLDQKSDTKWKSKKGKAIKKLEVLENKYKEIESKNNELRAQLANTTITNENFYHNTPKKTFINPESNDGVDMQNHNQPYRQISDSDNLQSMSTGSPNYNNDNDVMNHAPLMLHHPSTYSNMNGSVNYPLLSPPNQHSYLQQNNMNFNSERPQQISPMLSNVPNQNVLSSSPWNNSYNYQNVEPGIAYDDANHLITGLEDMIHDEADYPESISNYSNVFTTDQLDNYWISQKNNREKNKPGISISGNNEVSNVHAAADFLSPQPSIHSQASQYDNMLGSSYSQDRIPLSNSPMGPYGHAHKNSIGIQPSHAQSLLSATLNNTSMGSSYQDQFSFNNIDPFFSNDSNRQLHDRMKSLDLSNNMLRLPGSTNMPNRDASPLQFNFLPGNNIQGDSSQTTAQQSLHESDQLLSPNQYNKSSKESESSATSNPFWSGNSSNHSKEETPRRRNTNDSKDVQTVGHGTPKSHKRNQSNSSISSWTKLSWKNLTSNPSSPQRGSIDESNEALNDIVEDEKPPPPRKMSRLLSRSTMNNIFKKPTQESN
ncbi:Gta1p RNJ42_02335 [Nakaseomyces bracarensis]|uniref:Gta1p n=1 Tax=Nakaseomyces bracarensis TaxID=273131 RepID=UPI0038721D6E